MRLPCYFCVFGLIFLLSGCINRERVFEIHTKRGYTIAITADFHNDGICIPLFFYLLDPQSRRIHNGSFIACWEWEVVAQIEKALDIYESDDGRIAAVYDMSNPNWILAIIDFDSMFVYPSADTKRTKSYLRQRDSILSQLRDELDNQELIF